MDLQLRCFVAGTAAEARVARLLAPCRCASQDSGVSAALRKPKEKPEQLASFGLTLNEAASLQAAAKFLPGLLYRYTLLRGFPWGLAYICHQANATWIW